MWKTLCANEGQKEQNQQKRRKKNQPKADVKSISLCVATQRHKRSICTGGSNECDYFNDDDNGNGTMVGSENAPLSHLIFKQN